MAADIPFEQGASILVNVPAVGETLVGRDREIARIMDYVRSGASPVIVEGEAGMGKNVVARTVAYRCRDERLFWYIIWWSARYEPQPLVALLDAIARPLGLPVDTAQTGPAYTETVQARLGQVRCLLIVTKVTGMQHGEILDFLRAVPAPSCVLITTLSTDLAFGSHVEILPLEPAEAVKLLRTRAEQLACKPVLSMSDVQLLDFAQEAGGAPAALSLVVGLIKAGNRKDSVLKKLRAGEGDFSSLAADAYARLKKSGHEDAIAALNLICMSHESIAGEALESILAVPSDAVETRLLPPLRSLALIEERYTDEWATTRFQPANRLVREYYNACVRITQPEVDRKLRSAAAAYYTDACSIKGQEQNWAGHAWIEANLGELLAVLNWYGETQQWASLVALYRSLYYFLGVGGYRRQQIEYGRRAADAARSIDDRSSEAEFLVRAVGRPEINIGDLARAEEDIRRGLAIYEKLGNASGQARALRYLGTIERRRNRFEQAAALYLEALRRAEQAPEEQELRIGIHRSYGVLLWRQGDLPGAEVELRAALQLARELGHEAWLAETLSSLGEVRLRQGDLVEAENLVRESMALDQRVHGHKTTAYDLLTLARIAERRGDLATAGDLARQAKAIFDSLLIANETGEIDDVTRLSALPGSA